MDNHLNTLEISVIMAMTQAFVAVWNYHIILVISVLLVMPFNPGDTYYWYRFAAELTGIIVHPPKKIPKQ